MGLLRRRQRSLRRLELLLGQRPRDGTGDRGRWRDEQRPSSRPRRGRGRWHVSRLPADPVARLGHVRRPHGQLRDGGRLRGGQRSERRRGRRRRTHEHAVRTQRVHLRRQQGGGAHSRLLRHQLGQPQLPDELQRGDLRGRLALRHGAERHLLGSRRPAGPTGLPRHPRRLRRRLSAVPRLLEHGRRQRRRDRSAHHHQLLPQLEPDAVRRQGRHRFDGLDRVGEHRAGVRCRGAARVVRARAAGRRRPSLGQRDPPAADDDGRGRAAREHGHDRAPGQGQRGLGSALRLRPGQPRRSDGADRQPPGAGAGAGDGAHRSLRVALRRRSRNVRPAGGADRHARLVHADRRGSGPRRGDQGRGPRRGTALSARRGGLGARVRLRPGRARRRLRTDPGHAGRGHRRGRPRIPREPAEGDAREPRHDTATAR